MGCDQCSILFDGVKKKKMEKLKEMEMREK